MTTTEAPTVSQDNIDYFIENFSMQGLKYIRLELIREMDFRRGEIGRLTDELKPIQDRLRWYTDGMEGQRLELNNINAAMEHLKTVSKGK